MKIRDISRQFESITNLGYKNLVVSGCSFTYNNSEQTAVAWPYYLRDLGGFDEVYDCSLPGAGNYHICYSTMWLLENSNFNVDDTLVIIMWSGNTRDDCIVSSDKLNNYPMSFNYLYKVAAGITGGNTDNCSGNTTVLNELDKVKSPKSRSVENFLYVVALYNYLKQKRYKFLFLDYLDRHIPNRGGDISITDYLDSTITEKYKSMFANNIENLYKYAIEHNQLHLDDFHPSPAAHLNWTKERLIPHLLTANQLQTLIP